MSIDDYELMHGAVLTKICRNERPLSLTLIETSEPRSAYQINDVVLYIKHSTISRRNRNGHVWQFTFQPQHIEDLQRFKTNADIYLALVCGSKKISDLMHIAFLEPSEVTQCIDLTDLSTQWMSVAYKKRHNLRVGGSKLAGEQIQIKQSALENWVVPGR